MGYFDEEKQMAALLRIFTVLFAVGGFIFLLFPQIPHFFKFTEQSPSYISLFNAIGNVVLQVFSYGEHWEVAIPIAERFWTFSFFAMMMAISLCCFLAAYDIRKHRQLVLPVIAEKGFGSTAALLFFLFRCPADGSLCWAGWRPEFFPWLLVFLSDFPLFLLLILFYLRAQTGAYPQDYVSGVINKNKYAPMLVDRPILKSQQGTIVCAITDRERKDNNKTECLDRVLSASRFFEILDKYHARSGKSKQTFKVVIKPNFMMTYNKADKSTFTDPDLVEHLISRLRANDYDNITVVESQNTLGNYFQNRGVRSVAAYLGYNKPEDIVDLSEGAEEYDYGGYFGRHKAHRAWMDADFRISFAKNKTHAFCYFTLTIKNIYGTLPEQNKYLEYHKKREFDWPTIESLKHFPVHFGLVDAWLSGDGAMGVIADTSPKKTCAIIGGEKLVAVDHYAAKLMGLDPYVSRMHRLAVREFGDPEKNVTWLTSIGRYEDWDNVPPLLAFTLNVGEEFLYQFANFFMKIFARADRKYFPIREEIKKTRWIRECWLVDKLCSRFFAGSVEVEKLPD